MLRGMGPVPRDTARRARPVPPWRLCEGPSGGEEEEAAEEAEEEELAAGRRRTLCADLLLASRDLGLESADGSGWWVEGARR